MSRLSFAVLVAAAICFVQGSHVALQKSTDYSPIDPDTSYQVTNSQEDIQYVNENDDEDQTFSLSISEEVVSLAKSYIFRLASKAVAVVFGSIAAFALCKLTPICSIITKKCSSVKELRKLVTPDYLSFASNLLIKALDVYSDLNSSKND